LFEDIKNSNFSKIVDYSFRVFDVLRSFEIFESLKEVFRFDFKIEIF